MAELSELVTAGSWLLIATVLVLDLAGVLHRGTGFRLQAAGLLVMDTGEIVYQQAHQHGGWIFPVLIAGLALFLRGSVVSSRKRAPARRQPPRR